MHPATLAIDRILAALENQGIRWKPQAGGNISARCPNHQGKGETSLSLRQIDGRALVYCFAGCDSADIMGSLDLDLVDLFDNHRDQAYTYTNRQGQPTRIVHRTPAKGFHQSGNRAQVDLFRLPKVLEAVATGQPIWLVEGEQDVLTLESLDQIATTAPMGASNFGKVDVSPLKNARVHVIPDNDAPGTKWATQVRKQLDGHAARLLFHQTKEGKDITDHVLRGHTLDDLLTVDPPQTATTKTTAGADDSGGAGERGPSQASLLVALARERFDLFMSEDGRPYGVSKDGPNLALPLRGRAGLRSKLALMFTDNTAGQAPSQSALADAMTVLEGAAATTEPHTPGLRVARHQDSIVVDLGTSDGRCVVISPDGWQRQSASPVLFRRSGAMKPLPDPIRDGDGLTKLRNLFNLGEDEFQLLVGWLVAAFIPDLPHPILAFRGEQGTGKSKGAAMVISLADPSGAPKRTAPRDVKSWATQAFNSWALCLDNVSTVPDWLSDALCRAVTGDGIVDRALYTDDDVVVLEFRRVLAITTIDAGALAGDLAERLLTLELNLIPDDQRREEAELDKAFADAHPAILASLFDLLARVMAALPQVVLTSRPRMADFARVLAALDQVTGWHTLDQYRAGANDSVADVLDSDPFAQAVIRLVDQAGPAGLEAMTATQLLERIETPERPPKRWPKDATRASGQLKRLAPALRTIGIDVDDTRRGPRPRKQRLIILTATERRLTDLDREGRCETTVPASPRTVNQALTSEDRGDATKSPTASPLTHDTNNPHPRGDAGTTRTSTTPTWENIHRGDAGNAGNALSDLLSDVPDTIPDDLMEWSG